MPSIRAEGLAFAHADAVPILDAVDLHLPAGLTGLVGENGAGKTTLLRLVAGDLTPTAGRVRIDPDGGAVALCPQDVERAGPDVARLAGALARGDVAAFRTAARLGLDPATPPDAGAWSRLSPGERRRWQVAAALARDPDVLLMDEPTNHVDSAARASIVAALGAFRGAGIVVSHDRALLDAVTVRTLRLAAGRATLYPGPYGSARGLWEAELAAAWAARSEAQRAAREAEARLDAARREREAADRGRSTKHRSRGRYDSDARTLGARTAAAWAEDRAGRTVAVRRREVERAREALPGAPAERLLGRALFVGFERAPRPWLLDLDAPLLPAGPAPLLREVRVRLGRFDRVHLAGPNGSGKTTLLGALLAGARLPPERLLHLPQEVSPESTAAALAGVRALDPETRGRVLSLVAALGADPARLLATAAPSPGEARKLALALGLGRHAWAVVLDEPTNHLDLPSIERLERALAAYPGALLLVTHDERFAAACTTTTWRIRDGRLEV